MLLISIHTLPFYSSQMMGLYETKDHQQSDSGLFSIQQSHAPQGLEEAEHVSVQRLRVLGVDDYARDTL